MTNVTGTVRFYPIVIGKNENPRAFKGFNELDGLCDYYFNKKAWMNSGIFMDYLRSINEKLDRKIVLLLDNFSGHYVAFEALGNIVPIFFASECNVGLSVV